MSGQRRIKDVKSLIFAIGHAPTDHHHHHHHYGENHVELMTYHIDRVNDVQPLTVDCYQHLAVLLQEFVIVNRLSTCRSNTAAKIKEDFLDVSEIHLVDDQAGQRLCRRLYLPAEEGTARK